MSKPVYRNAHPLKNKGERYIIALQVCYAALAKSSLPALA